MIIHIKYFHYETDFVQLDGNITVASSNTMHSEISFYGNVSDINIMDSGVDEDIYSSLDLSMSSYSSEDMGTSSKILKNPSHYQFLTIKTHQLTNTCVL